MFAWLVIWTVSGFCRHFYGLYYNSFIFYPSLFFTTKPESILTSCRCCKKKKSNPSCWQLCRLPRVNCYSSEPLLQKINQHLLTTGAITWLEIEKENLWHMLHLIDQCVQEENSILLNVAFALKTHPLCKPQCVGQKKSMVMPKGAELH